ncbi:MAG: acyl-CoA dehydrogenase [FCB group bacterium]|nr:acyl-CoA dehydrogenase [FCB group bacterium]
MSFKLTEEQEMLVKTVRDFAQKELKPKAAYWDEHEEYPHENVKKLVELGLTGMTIPPEYGGEGRPLIDALLVVEEVAKACGTTARIVVETNMGVVGALMNHGTEAQKKKYLPMARNGEKPAIAITEPDAGSAATELRTRAEKKGSNYVLNGSKCFITGGGISKIYLVFARFEDIPGAKGIGGIFVEDGTPGFKIGKREPMMGLRGIPETQLFFEDCVVPEENLLVAHGDGFKKLMTAYNGQRLGAATVALGIAQSALDEAVAYTKERKQFGRPICEFQGLQWMLADMHTKLEAARLLLHRAAHNAGYGLPDHMEAAVAKAFTTEAAVQVTNDALQLFGGYGYSREYPLERLVREARMFTIGGGTVQMLKTVIASKLLGMKISQRKD